MNCVKGRYGGLHDSTRSMEEVGSLSVQKEQHRALESDRVTGRPTAKVWWRRKGAAHGKVAGCERGTSRERAWEL